MTSLDSETIIAQIKATCEEYQLHFRDLSNLVNAPISEIQISDAGLNRSFLIFENGTGVTLIKFSFEEETESPGISMVDRFPELKSLGTKLSFDKENFADGRHSALLIFTESSGESSAAEKAESILLNAGWQPVQPDQVSTSKRGIFTRGEYVLTLKVMASGEETASIICTICQEKGQIGLQKPRPASDSSPRASGAIVRKNDLPPLNFDRW